MGVIFFLLFGGFTFDNKFVIEIILCKSLV